MPYPDMPLEELKLYRGINPKPADFDDYWARALGELSRQTMDYTMEEAAFQVPNARCYHLYFTGVGGARVHASFARPEKIEGTIPGVAFFHGYTGHVQDFYKLLPYAQSGLAVMAMDVRGQFGLSDDNAVTRGPTVRGQIIRGLDDENPDKLFFRNIYLDTVQMVHILMSMDFVDETRIGARGDSQGGALTVACAALEPRVKLAAPWYPFLSDFQRVYELGLLSGAYYELGHYFKQKDPRHLREKELFLRLGYIDLHHLAPRIKAEVKMFTGLMDTTCPPSTQFAIYNHLTCKKSVEIYPEYDHEFLPEADEITLQMMLTL